MKKRLPANAKQRADLARKKLAEVYPDSVCSLNFKNSFELLVSTILAAQCTDARVNTVTPTLFNNWPTPYELALAALEELEQVVFSTGFYRAKAKNLILMAQRLVEVYDGEVPSEIEDLTSLAGVGRKTANVIRAECLGLPGLPVDTHVTRLSRRLKLTNNTDAVLIETDLCRLLPEEEWGLFSIRLIDHGRAICDARKPLCHECELQDFCPSFEKFT